MKKTEYSKEVAEKYDDNLKRKQIAIDDALQAYLANYELTEYNVLDVGCGTANYFVVQVEAFKDYNINWYGIDPSEDMLRVAKSKIENVEFRIGFAEDLPFENDYFDLAVTNFAFHHFENKSKALNEIARVLKKDGIFKMRNISPENMKRWWVYRYFPAAFEEDKKRFWDSDLIAYELDTRGFSIEISMVYSRIQTQISEILEAAEKRDTSQLRILPDPYFEQGIGKIKYELNSNPETRVMNEFALISRMARKLLY